MQLLVWPEQSPEDIIVVTITPDYPGSRHTGLVSGLKKFTWYFGATLCFTTPGDGPRSPPTLVQTHEDSEYIHTYTHFNLNKEHNTKNSLSPVNDNECVLTFSVFSPAVSISVIHSCVHNIYTPTSPVFSKALTLVSLLLNLFVLSFPVPLPSFFSPLCLFKGN